MKCVANGCGRSAWARDVIRKFAVWLCRPKVLNGMLRALFSHKDLVYKIQ